MDGYNGDNNDHGDFGAGTFPNGSGDHTRDFMSQPQPFSASGAYPGFGLTSSDGIGNSSSFDLGDNSSGGFSNTAGFTYSYNAPSPSTLGFGALDLNAGQSWPGMAGYEDILQSPAEDGGSGSSRGPPAGRVPSRGGRGSLGLRPPRRIVGASAGQRPRGGQASRGAAPSSSTAGARRSLVQPGGSNNVPPPGQTRPVDRAHWSDRNTQIFCELYCDEIDKGNCPKGGMTRWGWRNMSEEYFKKTELWHDNRNFGNKLRALKEQWQNLRNLQNIETGLGRNADGSVSASDEW